VQEVAVSLFHISFGLSAQRRTKKKYNFADKTVLALMVKWEFVPTKKHTVRSQKLRKLRQKKNAV